MSNKPTLEKLPAITHKVEMGQNCGSFFVIQNTNESGALTRIEIHAGKLKAGACGAAHLKVIAELINSKLEHGASIDRIADKYLVGHICREDMSHIAGGYKSCIDAIGTILLSRGGSREKAED